MQRSFDGSAHFTVTLWEILSTTQLQYFHDLHQKSHAGPSGIRVKRETQIWRSKKIQKGILKAILISYKTLTISFQVLAKANRKNKNKTVKKNLWQRIASNHSFKKN